VSAGSYRHVLQILTPTTADDGRGGQTTTWPTSGAQIHAFVRPASSREQAAAGSLQVVATHVIHTHYDARITSDKRLKRISPTGATLEIVGPPQDEDGRQRTMIVTCAEVI
jgi:SPP1 family predicted phage head-tail adaptor